MCPNTTKSSGLRATNPAKSPKPGQTPAKIKRTSPTADPFPSAASMNLPSVKDPTRAIPKPRNLRTLANATRGLIPRNPDPVIATANLTRKLDSKDQAATNPRGVTVKMTKNTKKTGKDLPKDKKKDPVAARVILGLKDAKQVILLREIKILMISHKVVIGGSSLESPRKMLLRKKKRPKKEQLLRILLRAGTVGIKKGLIPGKEESL
jgi:hypothetical protein